MSPSTVAAATLLGLAVFVLLGAERPAIAAGGRSRRVDAAGDDGRGDAVDGEASVGGVEDHPAGSEGGRRLSLRWLKTGRPAAAEAVDADVSSALALLALAYRSGLPTWDVLDSVAAGLHGPAARDLRQVAAALRWGADEAEAWASVGPAWAPAGRAVAIAHHAGVPPGAMLLAASDDLRDAGLERLELSAAKVGVRLVAPLGLVLLPAFCLTTVAPLVIALAGDVLRG